MRLLARLVATIAVVLVAVPVTVAAKTAPVREKPDHAGKPDKPADPVEAGTEGDADTEKPEKAEKEKADKERPPGRDRQDEDVPEHPLGGPPGRLKEPGEPAHPEHTVLGESVSAQPGRGTITVKAPGADEFVALDEGEPLPLESVVDATAGLVEIGSEAPDGTEQNAVVTGGVFTVQQDATGLTDLKLRGGDFSACRKQGVTARSAAKRKGARRGRGNVARGLWAAGKGRFRTHGRNATASVRGTRWAVVDRCHSTTVKVFDGVVDVRDLRTGRTIAVHAGERHVARERRP